MVVFFLLKKKGEPEYCIFGTHVYLSFFTEIHLLECMCFRKKKCGKKTFFFKWKGGRHVRFP